MFTCTFPLCVLPPERSFLGSFRVDCAVVGAPYESTPLLINDQYKGQGMFVNAAEILTQAALIDGRTLPVNLSIFVQTAPNFQIANSLSGRVVIPFKLDLENNNPVVLDMGFDEAGSFFCNGSYFEFGEYSFEHFKRNEPLRDHRYNTLVEELVYEKWDRNLRLLASMHAPSIFNQNVDGVPIAHKLIHDDCLDQSADCLEIILRKCPQQMHVMHDDLSLLGLAINKDCELAVKVISDLSLTDVALYGDVFHEFDVNGDSYAHLAVEAGAVNSLGVILGAYPELMTHRNLQMETPLDQICKKNEEGEWAELLDVVIKKAPEALAVRLYSGDYISHFLAEEDLDLLLVYFKLNPGQLFEENNLGRTALDQLIGDENFGFIEKLAEEALNSGNMDCFEKIVVKLDPEQQGRLLGYILRKLDESEEFKGGGFPDQAKITQCLQTCFYCDRVDYFSGFIRYLEHEILEPYLVGFLDMFVCALESDEIDFDTNTGFLNCVVETYPQAFCLQAGLNPIPLMIRLLEEASKHSRPDFFEANQALLAMRNPAPGGRPFKEYYEELFLQPKKKKVKLDPEVA